MNSFISWIGGKKLLRNEVVSRFPKDFNRYIEVFGGAGWVLFHSDRHAEVEIYNDYNSELVNLFRCVKYHCSELQKELSYMLNSRELFDDFRQQCNMRGLTDIQRASRFFMIVKTSYGSNKETYGCVKKDVNIMITYLEKIQERLKNAIIENKDFESIIKIQDKPSALFYLDPPYFGTEKYYDNVDFTKDDHQRLYSTLKNVKSKWLLSYNDCEYIRELYKDYRIDAVSRQHNLKARYGNEKEYKELIIMNY